MADFFTSGGAEDPTSSVVIAAPGNGATVSGSVHLMATASESQKVSQIQVWDNGAKLGWYGGQAVDQVYNMGPGRHTTMVVDLDSSYQPLHASTVTYTVQALTDGVQIVDPVAQQTISGTTVHVVAQASESAPVSQMQVWDNGVKLGWYPGTSVNTYFSLEPGLHRVTVLDLDQQYQILHESSVTYTVQ